MRHTCYTPHRDGRPTAKYRVYYPITDHWRYYCKDCMTTIGRERIQSLPDGEVVKL